MLTVIDRSDVVVERNAQGVRDARRAVAEACRGLARDVVEVARLLTSELVTNALKHGTGTIHVEVTRPANRVRISVDDDSTQRPHRLAADPDAECGRGLLLVESLSARWGVVPRKPGKRVWFELRTA